MPLEAGGRLDDVTVAYETWGQHTGSNAVLVEHALTGDSHVLGPTGPGHPTPGWWDGLVGPGRLIDTDRWFVVAANVLGGCQGTTGPASSAADGAPYGSRFPVISTRDQVTAEIQLADALGIDSWALVIGGSMGGMRALEWAVMQPDRVQRLAVIASSAEASAEQLALASVQLHAIRSDPNWHGGDYHRHPQGPDLGLGLARRIAHISYRSEQELSSRFGRRPQPGETPAAGGRFAVESYLDHHADKLVGRFDAGSYVTLTESMNSHDVGTARGGSASALRRVRARTMAVSVDSDRLYLPHQQRVIADGVPGAEYRTVSSEYGHDGFLIETEQITAALRPLLED
ncbi:homoserine O-acetyltransferase [soil metagenome]